MHSAELSRTADPRHSAEPSRLAGPGRTSYGSIVPVALAISCLLIALDQFLHTRPAVFAASPADQVLHWLENVVLAVPLAAIALWAGTWLSDRRRRIAVRLRPG